MTKDTNLPKKERKPRRNRQHVTAEMANFSLDVDEILAVWGRPEAYTPQACEAIIVSAAKGAHMAGWVLAAGAKSRQTLYNWAEAHPEFKEAMNFAKLVSLEYYESVGRKGTTGEIPGFNNGSWATIMNNKHSDEYSRPGVGSGSNTTTNINFNTVNLTSDEKVAKAKLLVQQLKNAGHELGNIYDAQAIENDND